MKFPRYVNGPIESRTILALASVLWLSSCGAPGPPQPPSLKLPDPVVGLTAIRNGNTVTLRWTMPKKTTDRLPLATQIRGPIHARICRREGPAACQPAGEAAFPAGAEAEFHETLPNSLANGEPRILDYWVELMSPKGRTAGPSNFAQVLAGAAPPAIAGLSAQVRADGVALHWNPASESKPAAVRLHRKLITPAPPKNPENNRGIKPDPEPIDRDLFVDAPAASQNSANGALDKNARFGEVYEYTAQRIDRITVDGKALELAGEISAPIRVDVVDTFPPAVPHGLVAVFAPQEKTIDLSWEPDTEEDLAGYIVYRADQAANADWKRISGSEPLIGPAFRDSTIQPGHSYRYAVTAIDLTNHESKRSEEATESVPQP